VTVSVNIGRVLSLAQPQLASLPGIFGHGI